MKRYKEYKNSGLEWIGEIPADWSLKSLKFLADVIPSNIDKKAVDGEKAVKLCNYVDVYKNDFITGGIDFMDATASDAQIEKLTLRFGDVIATKDSEDPNDIAVPALVKEDFLDVVCGYHLTLMRPDQIRLVGEYLFWLMNSKGYCQFFSTQAKGVTRYAVGVSSFKNLTITLPSLEEQTQIAKYLDHKTAQIDKLISDKEKLIELLNEERTAIINQAVTKGLNPDVPMKDSGIEWLGEVPEHWEVKRLKFIGIAFGGLTYAPENIVEETDGTLVLRSSNIQNGKLSLEDNVYVNSKISDKLTLKKGDILICSRNGSQHLIGKNICIGENMAGNTFGAFMMIFRSKNWKFLKHYFNSAIFTSQSGLFLTATINQLTTNTLNNFWIAIPESTIEQEEISKYVDEKKEEIETIVKKTNQEIQLLKEYKTALISEVVTGKVDLRHELLKPESLA